jgi:hypothetical protein
MGSRRACHKTVLSEHLFKSKPCLRPNPDSGITATVLGIKTMRLSCFGILFLLIPACAPFPDLDDALPPGAEDQEYPTLQPLEPVLARAAPTTPDAEETAAALDARIAALNARAEDLRKRDGE